MREKAAIALRHNSDTFKIKNQKKKKTGFFFNPLDD